MAGRGLAVTLNRLPAQLLLIRGRRLVPFGAQMAPLAQVNESPMAADRHR